MSKKYPEMPYEEAVAYEIPFGKHKGRTVGDLANSDDPDEVGYFEWLCNQADIRSRKFAEALRVASRGPGDETPPFDAKDDQSPLGDW